MNRVLVIVFCLLSGISFAQFGESIRTGRPGQAIGPFTLGKSVFQVQSGVDVNGFEDTGYPFGVFSGNSYVSNTVMRLGLTEHYEIGTAIDYTHAENNLQEEATSGVSRLSLATRFNIREKDGYKPAMGIQFNIALPLISEDFAADYVAPRINLVTGFNLPKNFSVITNSGISWNGNTNVPMGFYILNIGYGISDKFSVFAEWYGFVQPGITYRFENKFDGGFAFLVNNDLQLDLYGGYDTSNEGAYKEWFASAGVSWRCHWRDKTKNKE